MPRIAAGAGLVASAAFGFVAGCVVALAVLAASATLRAAYPPWNHGWPAVVEVLALLGAMVVALSTPMRHERASAGARALAIGSVSSLCLVIGTEMFGVLHIFGADSAWYLLPAH